MDLDRFVLNDEVYLETAVLMLGPHLVSTCKVAGRQAATTPVVSSMQDHTAIS